ncbi:hypothetical protein CR51_10235 [Caballeronia megalochromosomata]|nr:hypothetical protein CR51_10235 [Caballeronia megalochromosomata]
MVTVGRAKYSSNALRDYADSWEASRKKGEPSAPVELYGFSETKQYLLWKEPDGDLSLLEATKRTEANFGEATDWMHSCINRMKSAASRAERVKRGNNTLAKTKERVLAEVDGLPIPKDSSGTRANRQAANNELQLQDFAEGLKVVGLDQDDIDAAIDRISDAGAEQPEKRLVKTVMSVNTSQIIDTDFD